MGRNGALGVLPEFLDRLIPTQWPIDLRQDETLATADMYCGRHLTFDFASFSASVFALPHKSFRYGWSLQKID